MSTHAVARRAVLADALPLPHARVAVSALLVCAGALLMAGLAQVAIPVPPSPVPITGQTLGVVLCGAALGADRGALAMLLYAALGTVLPVYADGGSGAEHLWGATGGYIAGFVVAAWVVGRLAEHGRDRAVLTAFASFLAGQLIVFGVGVPWLELSSGMGWSRAFHDGFAIFVVGGLVKAALAALLIPGAWRAVRRLDAAADGTGR
jgi:biotin transport system substrate-specific component